jgi:hypothetical protein
MRAVRTLLLASLAIVLIGPTAATAQPAPPIASQATLDQLLTQRARVVESDRQVIREFLDRSEVQQVAARAGVDVTQARRVVGTLSGDELRDIASRARDANEVLAGGASTIVISTTTVIIVLLLLILIIVAVH